MERGILPVQGQQQNTESPQIAEQSVARHRSAHKEEAAAAAGWRQAATLSALV